jgi:glycosyltransferase involved in cell wall biosynthesis
VTKLADENDVEGLAQALLEVADATAEERRERAQNGRTLVESRHDARTVAEAIEDVYLEVLDREEGSEAAPTRGSVVRA